MHEEKRCGCLQGVLEIGCTGYKGYERLGIHLAFGDKALWVSTAGPTFFSTITSSLGDEAACTPRISLQRMLF